MSWHFGWLASTPPAYPPGTFTLGFLTEQGAFMAVQHRIFHSGN